MRGGAATARMLDELQEDVSRLRGATANREHAHVLESGPLDTTNVTNTHTAGQENLVWLVPFLVTNPMLMRRFLAGVSCASVTTIEFQAALYRVLNAKAYRQPGVRVSAVSDGSGGQGIGHPLEPGLTTRLVRDFVPFVTDSTSVVEYRHDLPEDVLLTPGAYAIGYTVSHVDGRWHYGAPQGIRSGYRTGGLRADRKMPLDAAVVRVAAHAPHFVLRSTLGVRMRPFNDEVNSVW